jgi:hypothetical protein
VRTLAYVPLAVSLFLLWIFDTETWLQRTLLLSLALALSLFLNAIGNRKKAYSIAQPRKNVCPAQRLRSHAAPKSKRRRSRSESAEAASSVSV